MTTFVRNYRNSFLDIETNNLRVLMDPWVNTANEGSWAATKNGVNYILNSINKKNIDYIYISHLHTDHFDLNFLKKTINLQKKKIKFLIKKFKDQRLKKKLISYGIEAKLIIELKDYETYKLNKDSKFIILPQLSSSNTENNFVNYDLDTSCIFLNKDLRLFNQVDNPYSTRDLNQVLKKLKGKINLKFDLAFLPYCAASEYPQSFINIDRNKEKEKTIQKGIKKFLSVSSLLDCRNFVPAGGTYNLDGAFSKLNKYLAIPNQKKIENLFIKKFKSDKNLLNPSQYYFKIKKYKINFETNLSRKNFESKINKRNMNAKYDNFKLKFSKKNIKETIFNVENKMSDYIKNIYSKLNTLIEFRIYEKQPVRYKNIKKEKNFIKHSINFKKNNSKKKNNTSLTIHIYYKAFLGIINNKVSWNEIQNHCLYERRPNKYEPDAIFWLNLYKFKRNFS